MRKLRDEGRERQGRATGRDKDSKWGQRQTTKPLKFHEAANQVAAVRRLRSVDTQSALSTQANRGQHNITTGGSTFPCRPYREICSTI